MRCLCQLRAVPPDDTPRKVVVFAIRHGEALHNIVESEARSSTEQAYLHRGCRSSSVESRDAQEEARKCALHDPELHDAQLSEKGKACASAAGKQLAAFLKERGLPAPTLVLSSPLQRALQTTAVIFPAHSNVIVCEELRFSSVSARSSAALEVSEPTGAEARASASSSTSSTAGEKAEEKTEVRERARAVLALIDGHSREHAALCLVTHKGWLREFERGPLGRPHALEFGNCELRVFELAFADGEVGVTRLHPPEEAVEEAV